MDNNTQTGEQTNTQQNGDGTQTEVKTFSQEEVNRIVQDRLAKERNKNNAQGPELDEREQELVARENKIKCTESLLEKGYNKELLDILDTSDSNKFVENLKKLEDIGVLRGKDAKPIPYVVGPTPGPLREEADKDLRQAFGLD
ncbi:MAG: hypothetical protein HFG31_03210 [Eubacterium sp.]|nr:hypothetical protein [Eubacterium sp.]